MDDDANVANLTSIRGKDWIFNAIWAACGEANAPKYTFLLFYLSYTTSNWPANRLNFNISTYRCIINIPLTCIFREGQPFKCLETDQETGAVRRVVMDDVPVDRKQDDQGFRGDSNRLLRILRYLIASFHHDNEYDVAQKYEEEALVCTVRNICCY